MPGSELPAEPGAAGGPTRSSGDGPGAWVHTSVSQQLVYGDGAVGGLVDLFRALGVRRAMLVTTPGRADSDQGAQVRRAMGRTLASTFAEVEAHVPTPTVQAALRQARRDGIDGVVSFGGGACIDTAKAVGFFTEQEQGTPGDSFADRPTVPHLSVPTTHAGAELTAGFAMTDPATRTKSGAAAPTLVPQAVLYDPALSRTLPGRLVAETAMAALAHALEAAWSPRRSPEAEALALAGIERLAAGLPAVVDDETDPAARAEVLTGSILAGRALQNASPGVLEGLALVLGGRTGLSHGLACALLVEAAVRFNAEAEPAAVARLGRALGADDAAAGVGALVERLGLPRHLSDLGVSDEDLEAVARLSQSNPAVRANPRPVSEDDALALLESAF